MDEVLDNLAKEGITFGALFKYALDTRPKGWLWGNIFKFDGLAHTILNALVSSRNSRTGQATVKEWAVNTTCRMMYQEGERTTRSKLLQVKTSNISADLVRNFDFEKLFSEVRKLCPTTIQVLRSFATTNRQQKTMNEAKEAKKLLSTTSAAVALLGERSRDNLYFRLMLGLWMYGNGASRQQFAISNHLGYSVSYTTLIGRGKRAQKPAVIDTASNRKIRHPGTLELLSQSIREETRKDAQNSVNQWIYDNINLELAAHDQVLGKTTDVQQNGTSVTCRILPGINPQDLKTSELLEGLVNAEHLTVEMLDFDTTEAKEFRECLAYAVMRIAVRHSNEHLRKFAKDVRESEPSTAYRADTEKTVVHPLPAFPINEATTTGNAEVISAILDELRLDPSDAKFNNRVTLVAGDQLSIARLRSITSIRAGNEGDDQTLVFLGRMPGLFHYGLNNTTQVLVTHLGPPNHDISNPASLSAHNNLLHRKAIVASSPPNYRTAKNLVDVSLYARVLHCLLRVSKKATLEDYSHTATFDSFKADAFAVIDQFANANVVEELRNEREINAEKGGDMIFENACLFMRDALVLREFTDAVRVGDAGRVFKVIKLWAYGFRGGGKPKYAQEAMEFVHNATCVWTEKQRCIFLKFLFINTDGTLSGNIPLDLKQEFMNNLLKNIFRAQGGKSNFWEWAALIGPLCELLQELNRKLGQTLGTNNSNRHAAPDLSVDIKVLMDSLTNHDIYEVVRGRKLAEDDAPVVDCVASGRSQMIWGSSTPLDDFNKSLDKLQRRLRIKPLVGSSLLHPEGMYHTMQNIF
ncbi:hypothetical protein SCHPADRAFT_838360 [Schizopora paradoxa]|uniref:DUF6589 domain-containing protein n=1 Tax=Schizopora paradoxa TaxID=27342 RepID=A0A0H2R9N6_9AGAM|nr:hypothetical protein SCHPADRAFT_838360 [Schizopora paradoxa]